MKRGASKIEIKNAKNDTSCVKKRKEELDQERALKLKLKVEEKEKKR